MTRPANSLVRRTLVLAALLALTPAALVSQARTTTSPETTPSAATSVPTAAAAFAIDDMLDVASFSVGDLTDDGRWLAVTTTTRRDAIGADFHRDGDPTYIRPRTARVWVIDTRTGERRAVFPDQRQVSGLAWSPDGERLAMLVRRGDVYVPTIWNRQSGRTSTIRVPASHYVAENSGLEWMPDGSAIVVALRDTAWRTEARARFEGYV